MNLGGLIGLFFGSLVAGVAWLYFRRLAKEKAFEDELYQEIQRRSFTLSWYISFGTVYVMLVISLLGGSLTALKVISIIFLVQIFSFVSVLSYLQLKIFGETKEGQQLSFVVLFMFILLGFGLLIITIFYID